MGSKQVSFVERLSLSRSHWVETSVPCGEVVPISEGPLSEVPLYTEILREMKYIFSVGVVY